MPNFLQRPEKLMTADGGLITGAGKAYDSGRGLITGAGKAYDSARGGFFVCVSFFFFKRKRFFYFLRSL